MTEDFHLTNEEADLVHKLVSDALERATDETVQREIGDADTIRTAVGLYMRLATR